MSHGERRSRKSSHAGHEYWKPVGINGKATGWRFPCSARAGTNKKTKRITQHSIRQQVKKFVINLLKEEEI